MCINKEKRLGCVSDSVERIAQNSKMYWNVMNQKYSFS